MAEPAFIKQWLENYLKQECGLQTYHADMPLFKQLDSFQVIGVLLACEEQFGLGEQLAGDVLTPMTVGDIVDYLASRAV